MAEKFPIIEVSPNASEQPENLGTKEKFWFHHESLGRCLYKKARPNTGEDWAEKIAAQLCELLRLPHAIYELATFNGERGTVSPSFVPEGGSLHLAPRSITVGWALLITRSNRYFCGAVPTRKNSQ